MLQYLVQLPHKLLGKNLFQFLSVDDIVELANAATSHEAQEFLYTILPHILPINIYKEESVEYEDNTVSFEDALLWCHERKCRIEYVKLSLIELKSKVLEQTVASIIELHVYVNKNAHIKTLKPLSNMCIRRAIVNLQINGMQSPTVMEAMFAQLASVRILHIKKVDSSNLSQWIGYITQIAPGLKEFSIEYSNIECIRQFLPMAPFLSQLTKLKVIGVTRPGDTDGRIGDKRFKFGLAAEGDAEVLTFIENCPHLEELTVGSLQLTDLTVVTIAQHCLHLRKLCLDLENDLQPSTLKELTEMRMPHLQKLEVPRIPMFPSAEAAADCAYALSRIRELVTKDAIYNTQFLLPAIPHLTGLRKLVFMNPEDSLLLPGLMEHCAHIERVQRENRYTNVTPEQFRKFAENCPRLKTMYGCSDCYSSAADLTQLASSCPELQVLYLEDLGDPVPVPEEGVLAFMEHCRHMQELSIPYATVSESTVQQLARRWPRLSSLCVSVRSVACSSTITTNATTSAAGDVDDEGEMREESFYKAELRQLRER